MQIFTLTFRAPLMVLQGPRIDNWPQGLPIPTRSMVTGLIGAALGVSRREADTLQSIQDTMRLAVVVHRRGVEVVDYQTANLSKPHLRGPMWSSGTTILEREGGDTEGTRIQHRPYVCDGHMTVLVQLLDGAPFTAEHIIEAFDQPKRVLAYGRMSCPPIGRIAGDVLSVGSLEEAVSELPGDIYLPSEVIEPQWGDLLVSIPGTRDWRSRLHGGAEIYVRRAAQAENQP